MNSTLVVFGDNLMKYIYALIICLCSTFAMAADNQYLIEGGKRDPSKMDKELNQFMLDQLKERRLSEEQEKEKHYQELLEKYPDVVPRKLAPNARTGVTGLSKSVHNSDFSNTVFFSPGSSFLNPVQEEKLNKIIETLKTEPTFNIVIVGHSSFNSQIEDPDERLYYNRWISGRRSVQVWNFFINKGITSNRIAAFAKDSQEPLNGEDTVDQTHMNRRVELRLTNQPIAIGKGYEEIKPIN